jgi:hypothetical protein
LFINKRDTIIFNLLKVKVLISLFLVFVVYSAQSQQFNITGTVVENDSITPMPFVYIINKSNGNGTMSDNNGHFSMTTFKNDTLICSYVGFLKAYLPVNELSKNDKGAVKLYLTPMPINLAAINITTFKLMQYERDYMNDIIEKSKLRKLDYVNSPISAMYMQFSKEGKQIRKLSKIFEELIIEEQVQKKLSREILVKLTGDENIDYYAFRRYCYYVSDYYIVYHDGAELYSKVMDCYKNYKADGRDQPLRKRELIEGD